MEKEKRDNEKINTSYCERSARVHRGAKLGVAVPTVHPKKTRTSIFEI